MFFKGLCLSPLFDKLESGKRNNNFCFGKSLEKVLNSVRALIVYQATDSQLLHYLFHWLVGSNYFYTSELQMICNIPGLRRGGRISSGRDEQLGAEIKIPHK